MRFAKDESLYNAKPWYLYGGILHGVFEAILSL